MLYANVTTVCTDDGSQLETTGIGLVQPVVGRALHAYERRHDACRIHAAVSNSDPSKYLTVPYHRVISQTRTLKIIGNYLNK